MHTIMNCYSLTNIIQQPTRITSNTSTLIDPIIIIENIHVHDSGILNVDQTISDHRATYVYIHYNANVNSAYKRKIWNYKGADFKLLNKLIHECDWEHIIENTETIENATLNFTEKFMSFIHLCIPENTVTIRPNDKPWMDSLLKKTIRIRNRLRTKAQKTKRESDWISFRKIRNKVNNMKKFAISHFYDNIDSQLKDASTNDNKLYWKLLKHFFNTKSSSELPPIQYTDSNGKDKSAFSDLEKIELLNNYFTSITRLDDNNQELPNIELKTNDFCPDIHIQEQEINDIISIIPVNKAIGPDGISHKMLKSCKDTISKPLCKLFNKSLSLKTFPDCWKLAHVIPLFKKDDPSAPCNYRPVSLLSCISKIFERIIFKHIYNFLHSHNLFYKYQAGFLPGHSTVYQLLETYHSIVESIDNGDYCCMVFCDLSKAFDRVWHKGLIHKLQMYGIRGSILQWFGSYLNNRTQKVMY